MWYIYKGIKVGSRVQWIKVPVDMFATEEDAKDAMEGLRLHPSITLKGGTLVLCVHKGKMK